MWFLHISFLSGGEPPAHGPNYAFQASIFGPSIWPKPCPPVHFLVSYVAQVNLGGQIQNVFFFPAISSLGCACVCVAFSVAAKRAEL